MPEYPPRIQAIIRELERAASEYREAKAETEAARVRFSAAREKFAATRNLASEMLGPQEQHLWFEKNPDVNFAAVPIGGAIRTVLWQHAWERGEAVYRGKAKEYYPYMSVQEIADKLEQGGFDFQSATPNREVNAALMNLTGIERREAAGGKLKRYATENPDTVLSLVREYASNPEEDQTE